MTTTEMQDAIERLKLAGFRESKMWTDLVWKVVQYFKLDKHINGTPVVELEKRWVECINIAKALKPISMREWSTGRTLDWIEKKS